MTWFGPTSASLVLHSFSYAPRPPKNKNFDRAIRVYKNLSHIIVSHCSPNDQSIIVEGCDPFQVTKSEPYHWFQLHLESFNHPAFSRLYLFCAWLKSPSVAPSKIIFMTPQTDWLSHVRLSSFSTRGLGCCDPDLKKPKWSYFVG